LRDEREKGEKEGRKEGRKEREIGNVHRSMFEGEEEKEVPD